MQVVSSLAQLTMNSFNVEIGIDHDLDKGKSNT